MITYCKKCLNPSTRPNTYFDESGICPVCVYENKKKDLTIDWDSRKSEIKEIKDWGVNNSKSSYDCIVTVSGGKDSMRQAFFARDELGMNPLLVCCMYPPEEIHERGAKNISNLIENGFDCISLSLDPVKWKEMMKHGFYKFGNFFKSTEMALYAIPVHVAIAYKIPLMFYGENPALTIGEKHGRLDGNAIGIQEANTIKGGPKSLDFEDGNLNDFHFYEYPTYENIDHAGIRIVYLGYYIQDWYGKRNAEIAISNGLTTRKDKPENIGDLWGVSALDEDFRIVNQHLKYLKFGFGHVTDQVCEAIHQELIDRSEAVKLVKKYDGNCSDDYIRSFCDFLEISTKEFWRQADKFVNKNLFEKVNGKWKPKFTVK
tara:strand:- start:18 stop:1136 length:1119 start_codon:yes stop_codon:yes gene_type:complete